MATQIIDPESSRTALAQELPLLVRIWPEAAEYRGTRAQIEAENVIPCGTKWPDGREQITWSSGALLYRLSRVRAANASASAGAVKSDLWSIRWWLKDEAACRTRALKMKGVGRLRARTANSLAIDDAAFLSFKSALCI